MQLHNSYRSTAPAWADVQHSSSAADTQESVPSSTFQLVCSFWKHPLSIFTQQLLGQTHMGENSFAGSQNHLHILQDIVQIEYPAGPINPGMLYLHYWSSQIELRAQRLGAGRAVLGTSPGGWGCKAPDCLHLNCQDCTDSWFGPCESTEHTWVFPLQGAQNSRVRQHFYQVLRVYKGNSVHAEWHTMPLYGNKGSLAFIAKMLRAAWSELLLTLSV